ncbi:hypothetical protein PO909_023290, partial [Leuciscus waleckii]
EELLCLINSPPNLLGRQEHREEGRIAWQRYSAGFISDSIPNMTVLCLLYSPNNIYQSAFCSTLSDRAIFIMPLTFVLSSTSLFVVEDVDVLSR